MDAGKTRPIIGRYRLSSQIGSGGMASVHLGRLLGPAGFARTVAIKRMNAALASSGAAAAMFLDEARLASRIRHANVVATLDVVVEAGEILLVLEYVHGESLDELACGALGGQPVPPRIASAIATSVLEGLHAAHGACGDDGAPLHIVHRDVSPHNVLVGAEGVVRVLDFGIAKAVSSASITRTGEIKGKLGYMAPEQIDGAAVDARTDVFAAGVLLWEMIVGARLYPGEERLVAHRVLSPPPPPSRARPGATSAFDEIVLRALEPARDARFESAHAMAAAVEAAEAPAGAREVASWLSGVAGAALARRAALVAAVERDGVAAEEGTDVSDLPTDVGLLPGVSPELADTILEPPPASIPAPPRAWSSSAPPAPRSRRTMAVVAASGLLLAAAATAYATAQRPRVERAHAVLARWQVEPAIATPADPTTADAPAPAGDGESASPPPRSGGGGSAKSSQVSAATAAAASSGRAQSCRPPYTIGDDGIRRWKPWCVPGATGVP